jgi:hypothetical protein
MMSSFDMLQYFIWTIPYLYHDQTIAKNLNFIL